MNYKFSSSLKTGINKISFFCSSQCNRTAKNCESLSEDLIVREPVRIDYPKIRIASQDFNRLLQYNNKSEAQVIIHFSFSGRFHNDRIRIWKSTFLFPRECEGKSILLHAENITFYPEWMPVGFGHKIVFTLFFSALPKDCAEFDLHEQIPEPGGFVIKGIKRNRTDVYYVRLD